MSHPSEIFGEVISSYSRAQALEDGELVDVSTVAREAGIRFPVAMTRAAWGDCVEWPSANKGMQDESGRLWDVVYMLSHTIRRGNGGHVVKFELLRVPNTPTATAPRKVELVAYCGPGDHMEPVITIMLPGED